MIERSDVLDVESRCFSQTEPVLRVPSFLMLEYRNSQDFMEAGFLFIHQTQRISHSLLTC